MSSSARTHVGLQFDIERVYARRFVLIFVCSRGPRLSSACRLSSMTDSTLCTRTRFATTPRSPDTRATTSARRRREGVFLRPVDVCLLFARTAVGVARARRDVAFARSFARVVSFRASSRRVASAFGCAGARRSRRSRRTKSGGSYSKYPKRVAPRLLAPWCSRLYFPTRRRAGGARGRARTRVRVTVTVRGDGAR